MLFLGMVLHRMEECDQLVPFDATQVEAELGRHSSEYMYNASAATCAAYRQIHDATIEMCPSVVEVLAVFDADQVRNIRWNSGLPFPTCWPRPPAQP